MVIGVESKVPAPLVVPKASPIRPQKSAGVLTDSSQRAAQAFIETLPSDVRDQIGQGRRDSQKRNQFDQPERSSDEQKAPRVDPKTQPLESSLLEEANEPLYSQPILTPGAVFLQAQFSFDDSVSDDANSLSSTQHEAFHKAYLSAGAQPGGRTAAMAAQIARDELANKTLIVPPVLTSVNLTV